MAEFQATRGSSQAWIVDRAAEAGPVLHIGGGRSLVDPRDPSVFYTPTMQVVYKSLDGGRTWRQANVGLGVVGRDERR